MTIALDAAADPPAPQLAPAAQPEERLITPVRFAAFNVALALALAVVFEIAGLPPPQKTPLPERERLSRWTPQRAGRLAALKADADNLDAWAEGKRRLAETIAVLPQPAPLPPAGAAMTAFSGTARMLSLNS